MKKVFGCLAWLLIVIIMVVVAQVAPPWSRVDDPDLESRAVRGLWEQRSDWVRSGGRAVTDAIPGVGCEMCNSEKTIQCSACKGSGRVERVTRIRCDQCNGSGVYRSRISSGRGMPCSFCNAKGYRERTEKASCDRCDGQGRVACPSCQSEDRESLIPW